MANLWIYVLGFIGALILGAVLGFLFFGLPHFLKLFFIKRKHKIPKKVTNEYLESKQEVFATPPKPITDEKEVKEDERRSFEKFREFEKLRRRIERERPTLNGSTKPIKNVGQGDISSRPILNSGVSNNENRENTESGEVGQVGVDRDESRKDRKKPTINRLSLE